MSFYHSGKSPETEIGRNMEACGGMVSGAAGVEAGGGGRLEWWNDPL